MFLLHQDYENIDAWSRGGRAEHHHRVTTCLGDETSRTPSYDGNEFINSFPSTIKRLNQVNHHRGKPKAGRVSSRGRSPPKFGFKTGIFPGSPGYALYPSAQVPFLCGAAAARYCGQHFRGNLCQKWRSRLAHRNCVHATRTARSAIMQISSRRSCLPVRVRRLECATVTLCKTQCGALGLYDCSQ